MQDLVVPLAGGFIAFVVWLIRLEGKVKAVSDKAESTEETVLLRIENVNLRQNKLDREHESLNAKVELMASKIIDKLSDIEKHLGRMEGRFSQLNISNDT